MISNSSNCLENETILYMPRNYGPPEADGYNYVRLENPIVLTPGESYYLASDENTFGGNHDEFPSDGQGSLNGDAMFGTGAQLDGDLYQMAGDSTWHSYAFAPLVNVKIN